MQFVHAMRQGFRVVCEVLCNFGSGIEADNEGVVVSWSHRLIEKFNGGFLLELKAVANRVAGINEQADLQGQISFGVEAADFLGRFTVIDYAKIILLQVGDVAAVFVGDGKDHVDFVGPGFEDCEIRVLGGLALAGA